MIHVNELIDSGIITKVSASDHSHLIHLEIKGISLVSGIGIIGETVTLPPKTPITAKTSSVISERGWFLVQGVYEIELYQGCNIPKGVMVNILPNIDILNCGALIFPLASELPVVGYKADNIKLMLQVTNSLFIKHKSIAGKFYASKHND